MKNIKDVEWKVGPCFSGEDCWCRIIVPVENIITSDGEIEEVVGPASINKDIAEYIVKLHNDRLHEELLNNITFDPKPKIKKKK